MTHVLIIEDDEDTAAAMAEDLVAHGYEVARASTGPAGLALARAGNFDVVTIDRMLPEIDGLAVIETLRQDGVDTPMLVVSALGEVDERVRGLRAGGDDYLTKPFANAELRARIDALLRRSREPRDTLIRIGDLELDRLTRSARRAARVLNLTPRELELLDFLARHAGQVVTRAMLFEQVWGYRFDPRTNLVDVHVGRLRREVDRPGEAPLIQTVRGAGFSLRAPVS
jgi:two-component system OmpR family response regulator